MHTGRRVHPILYVATLIWGTAVVAGLGGLWVYATRAGEVGDLAIQWPVESTQVLDRHRPTLLVFAHPKCPCTRATIDELSWIMTRCQGRVTCRVLFTQPEQESMAWAKTATWEAASAIPGVEVCFDSANHEADVFGAATSGHAMLYDTKGRLLFQGGITSSRGHRGDNLGCNKIVSMLRDRDVSARSTHVSQDAIESTHVFGCPLSGPSQAVLLDADAAAEES